MDAIPKNTRERNLIDVASRSSRVLEEVFKAVHEAGLTGQAAMIKSVAENLKKVVHDSFDDTQPIDVRVT